MQALRRLVSTGTSKVSISDNPSSFDIINEVEGDAEATVQVGTMVFSLDQFKALLPFPQVALPYMRARTNDFDHPITYYGIVLPSNERKALAIHPNPFMPGYRLWKGISEGNGPVGFSFLHQVQNEE